MNKHLQTTALVTLVLIGNIFFASPLLSIYNFTHIENKELKEDTLQVRNLINAEAQQLNVTAGDYAGRRDAYAFMRDRNPKFISTSLGEAFYSKLHLNLFCMTANNETYLGPRITELILKDYLKRIPDKMPLTFESLTTREREIIQLIADGQNSKELAHQFGVSIKTIEVHRHNIMNKLNLNSVASLTKYALREGLTSSC